MTDIFDQITAKTTSPEGDIFDEISYEPSKAEKAATEFKFFGYKPEPEQIERIREPLRRELGGIGTSLASGLGGQAGNILQMIQSIPPFEQIGGRLSEIQKLLGMEEKPEILPTSETIRSLIDEATGGELEPTSEISKVVNKIVELGTALGASGLTGLPLALSSTLPVFVEEILDKYGASPKAKAVASSATMIVTGLIGKQGPKQLYSKLFDKARALSKGAFTGATMIEKQAKALEQRLLKGFMTQGKSTILTKVRELLGKIKDGKISVDELIEGKIDLHEKVGELMSKDIGKPGVARARANANALDHIMNNGLSEYGKTNPEFHKIYSKAQSLFAETKNIPKIIKFFDKKLDLQSNDPLTNALLILNPSAFIKSFGATKGLKFLNTLFRNPNIRSLWTEAVGLAIKENTAGLSNIVNKLDEEIKKEKKNFSK